MNRSVIVTGGAKRIGGAIARHLARRGWRVIILYRQSADDAASTAKDIAAAGGTAFVVQGDIARQGGAGEIIDQARRVAGTPVDALVNSASTFGYDTVPGLDDALLDQAIAANLKGPVALAIALAGQRDLAAGAVVNLLDQKLANLNPDFFSYTCSKLALEGATVMLAQALAPRVRVNAVSPGLSLPSHDQTAAEFAEVAADNLLRQPVALDDIAMTVAMLLDNQSVTGQNIFVDCGQRFVTRDRDVMFARRDPALD